MVRYVNHHRPYTRWAELCADGTLPCHGSIPDPVLRQIIGLSSLLGTAILLVPLIAIIYWKTIGKSAWKAHTVRQQKESAQRRINWSLAKGRKGLAEGITMPWSPLTPNTPGPLTTLGSSSAVPNALNASIGSSTLSPPKAIRYPPRPNPTSRQQRPNRTSSYAYVGSSTRAPSLYGVRQSVYGFASGDTPSRDPSGSQVSLLGMTATRPRLYGPTAGGRCVRPEADTSSDSDQSLRKSGTLPHHGTVNPFGDPASPLAQHTHPLQQLDSLAGHSPGHTSMMTPTTKYATPQGTSFEVRSIGGTLHNKQEETSRDVVQGDVTTTSVSTTRQRSIRGRYRNSLQVVPPERQGRQLTQRQQYQAQSDNLEENATGVATGRGDPLPSASPRPNYQRTFSDDSLYSHPFHTELSYADRDSMASRISARSTRHLLSAPSSRQVAGAGGNVVGMGIGGEWTLDDVLRENLQNDGTSPVDEYQHHQQFPRQAYQTSLGNTKEEGDSIRLLGSSNRIPSSSTQDRQEELRRHHTIQRREERREKDRRLARELADDFRYLCHSSIAADWGWYWRWNPSKRRTTQKKKKGKISSTLRGVKRGSFGKGNKSPAPWDGMHSGYDQQHEEDIDGDEIPAFAHSSGNSIRDQNDSCYHWHFDQGALGVRLVASTNRPAISSSSYSSYDASRIETNESTLHLPSQRDPSQCDTYSRSHARSRSGNHLASASTPTPGPGPGPGPTSKSRSQVVHQPMKTTGQSTVIIGGSTIPHSTTASARDIESEARLRRAIAELHGIGQTGPFYR